VTVHNGFLVARGEIHPVENVMISGNMPDILRKIDAVANDVREIGNVVTPSVLVSEIQVIGDS
jgi:PmbA protein